jgi:hypothetical protein
MSHHGLLGALSIPSNYIEYKVALPRGDNLSPLSNGPVSSPEVVSNTPAFLIKELPREIRLKIFESVCVFDGKMPGLIIALRPLKKLYYEALELFYKNSSFVLHRN